MGKKKNKETPFQALVRTNVHPRRLNARDRLIFDKQPRHHSCLAHRDNFQSLVALNKLDRNEIRYKLGENCKSIEHQIVTLRELTRITRKNLQNRRELTKHLVDCLYKHHGVIYEAILFGSSINGLGFSDSDLDLRLRPLIKIGCQELEPVHFDKDLAERTLRDIAFQTTRCAPALGNFVPSSRCPIAKLTFLQGDPTDLSTLSEGISYDICLSSANSLGSFNSIFLRFLCKLSPKFHLLATVIRYWSKVHNLIVSGYLSSYALVNMLIFFCQTLDPPLLPTVDQMRDIKLAQDKSSESSKREDSSRALTQLEWQCIVCLDKEFYPESKNREPLGVLLLKFFEFYLNFKYSFKIITTRTGRALSIQEFQTSEQYHPRYPIKEYINIQDPFDLRHNLTCGITGEHFNTLMIAINHSYERLSRELIDNFLRPGRSPQPDDSDKMDEVMDSINLKRDWGLNAIFVSMSENEIKQSW